MIDKEGVEVAATVTTAVGELIRVAGDSPEAKQAGQNVGRAAITLTAAINNCLLPIAAVNFGFEKAKQYFGSLFPQDLAKATEEIPQESLTEPKPSLAGPALQALAFSHDEPDLKSLYIKLLATAMDLRSASQAHPAFVEILRQLTAKEARTLQYVLTADQTPICQIQEVFEDGGRRILQNHVLNWRNGITDKPAVEPELPAMVDNWVRLGLVEVSYTRWLLDVEAYSWMESRPEILSFRAETRLTSAKVSPQKGLMATTAFGKLFASATGMSRPANA